ncbi:hypothetical protein PPYR_07497 [Photinus pyralis]|uniref:Sodium channel and clathrin linker 1 n=1 Tax=Photinus pyralis TaxID=7054 RepID=A0A5N4AQL5_PHOPY|nr:CAP-Gly domain-containing linker protein 1-like [Photinus pyralis]KAB0799617.1 hypothetical protein PPYR_07497 [Photinus pyralis]
MEKDYGYLTPLIQEYEVAIETLTNQLQFYAHEQERLRAEITTLIKENKALSVAIREVVDAKAQFEVTDKQNLENCLVHNLKNQLSLTLQEKETVVLLWQNSLKNIDHLEEELNLFAGKSHGFISKAQVQRMKQSYEKEIQHLEEQLTNSHTKIQTILKTSSQTIDQKRAELEKAISFQQTTTEQMNRLENEVKKLESKIRDSTRIRDKLQVSLEMKDNVIQEMKAKERTAKEKVTEAVQIVETALFEKDAAVFRESQAREEAARISKILSELMDKADARLKNEVEAVQQVCDIKLKETQTSVGSLKEELNEKNLQLQKSTYDCKLLENEVEKAKKGNLFVDESHTSKLLVLEKNLESTFQKLLLSEKKLLKVEAEKESLKLDMEQMGESYQNDIKTRDAEQLSLKNERRLLQKQLKMCNENLQLATDNIKKLKSKLDAVERNGKAVQSKLQSYLEMQINLNKKWKEEVHGVLRKYEAQVTDLKNNNKYLRNKLKQTINRLLNRNATNSHN